MDKCETPGCLNEVEFRVLGPNNEDQFRVCSQHAIAIIEAREQKLAQREQREKAMAASRG